MRLFSVPVVECYYYYYHYCSLWETKNYSEAQKQFETAIVIRRQLVKDHKLPTNLLEIIDKNTEIELKFRIAKCLVEVQQYKEASVLLQAVPLKQRPAKMNMLLTKMSQGESGTDKSLIANYKEVLRKCPLAFECIDGLISLGVKGTEVNSLIINGKNEKSMIFPEDCSIPKFQRHQTNASSGLTATFEERLRFTIGNTQKR